MSLFAKLFGSNNKDKPMSPQDALQRLREVEEMLMKKIEFLEEKINRETEIAKKAGVKNKRVALAALKRKKRLEKNIVQIDGTVSTIEIQREALENASTNTEVFNVITQSARSLELAHQNLDVEKVQDLMDNVTEQQELSSELLDILSTPLGQNEYDEDDLLEELEAMEQEDLNDQLLQVGGVSNELPSVPVEEPAEAKKAPAKASRDVDADDLNELGAWAAS